MKTFILCVVVAGVLAFSVFAGIMVWETVPCKRFYPVRMDKRQQLRVYEETLTREQADSVEAILYGYGEQYRRDSDSVILITMALQSDTDLVWNYTTKAGLSPEYVQMRDRILKVIDADTTK